MDIPAQAWPARGGTNGRSGDVFNPATGEVEARCPYASAADIDEAVVSIENSDSRWKSRSTNVSESSTPVSSSR